MENSYDENKESRLEEIEDLIFEVNKFESKIENMVYKGREIIQRINDLNGADCNSTLKFDMYFLKRIEYFLQGYEIFSFDDLRETLIIMKEEDEENE